MLSSNFLTARKVVFFCDTSEMTFTVSQVQTSSMQPRHMRSCCTTSKSCWVSFSCLRIAIF